MNRGVLNLWCYENSERNKFLCRCCRFLVIVVGSFFAVFIVIVVLIFIICLGSIVIISVGFWRILVMGIPCNPAFQVGFGQIHVLLMAVVRKVKIIWGATDWALRSCNLRRERRLLHLIGLRSMTPSTMPPTTGSNRSMLVWMVWLSQP